MDCQKEGCIRPVFRVGLCHKHYDEKRAAASPPCSAEDCGLPVHASGLCNKHYRASLYSRTEQCSVVGCGRAMVANGLCGTHRKRVERRGSLDPARPHDWGGREAHPLYASWSYLRRRNRFAPVCEEWLSDFWKFALDMGDRPTPQHVLRRRSSAVQYDKENCYWARKQISLPRAESRKAYMREWHKQYRENNPEKHRDADLRRRRGVTAEQFDEMLAKQNGKCAICGNGEVAVHRVTGDAINLAVDHCHTTGVIRGLLCTNCNKMLGHAKDDPEILKRAIAYLAR